MRTINDYQPEAESLLAALAAGGYTLDACSNDQGVTLIPHDPARHAEFVEEVLGADDCQIFVTSPDGKRRWLYLVFGNEPGVIVCDHYGADEALAAIVTAEGDKWEGKAQPTREVE